MRSNDTSGLRIFVVDAFTAEPFRGNPAGVCLWADGLSDGQMQIIAAEMKHSETAFISAGTVDDPAGAGRYRLRWFTPACEVPLCGHGTIAASHVLFNEVGVESDELLYDTLSGELKAIRENGGIRLDFPRGAPEPFDPPGELLDALGIPGFAEAAYCAKTNNTIIRFETSEEVKAVEPDFAKLEDAKIGRVPHGVIVTSESGDGYEFVSRFFAPAVGVPEDPVTGVAHTVLAPFWAERLGRNEMRAYQASARGGELTVRLVGEDRVNLIGEAVTVLRGELIL
ncbi:MAG: PhzF family phenazine biosynthesis protein [Candidatus Coatesbacteria bacterium]|nr:MAG: PhzF family phenazine biosynthesis protein [Candidatus Coatesbacteria bacterium]